MYLPNYEVNIGRVTYTYLPWEDVGDDVIKIWHDIKDSDGTIFDGDWSPYKVPTLEEFTTFCHKIEERRVKDDEA